MAPTSSALSGSSSPLAIRASTCGTFGFQQYVCHGGLCEDQYAGVWITENKRCSTAGSVTNGKVRQQMGHSVGPWKAKAVRHQHTAEHAT